jgi:ferredoxin--NADP+ reductase
MMNVQVDNSIFVTEQVKILTPSTYVIRFSRNGMKFNPGQHLVVGLPGSDELREYSIYSGIDDPYLEVLIKEIDEGMVSKALKNIAAGDPIRVKGPYGFFLGDAPAAAGSPLLFIASGTGIAPFHSYIRSFPRSDFRIIHGIREMDEAYDMHDYPRDRLTLCTSRDRAGDFNGRLTDYLKGVEPESGGLVYLCGNSQMIYDAMDILHEKGVPQRNIFTEVYF